MPNKNTIPISAAPPRPLIGVHQAAGLREALGKRDLSKGERGLIERDIFPVLTGRCAVAGYPSLPIVPQRYAVGPDGQTTGELIGDDAATRMLKTKRVDGVAAALVEAPGLFSELERELVPMLLREAVTDFRPHAGHARAVPTHVGVAQARAAAAQRQADAQGAAAARAAVAAVQAAHAANPPAAHPLDDTRLATLEKNHAELAETTRLQHADLAGKLDLLLAHITAPPSPPPPSPPLAGGNPIPDAKSG